MASTAKKIVTLIPESPAKPARSSAAKNRPTAKPTLSVVTSNRHAESELAAKAECLRKSRSAAFICDLDWNITFANDKAIDLLQFMEPNLHAWSDAWKSFSAKEIVGSSLDFLFSDEPLEFRRASNPVNHPFQKNIRTGPCTCDVMIDSILDKNGKLRGFFVDWDRITEKIEKERQITMLLAALDGANTNIMMVDPNLKLVYMNKRSTDTFRSIEPDMKAAYGSAFRADEMIGKCIDEFHKNPATQRAILKEGTRFPYSANIQVGPLTLSLAVSQVNDPNGKPIAYSAEWADVSEKLRVEKEQQAQLAEKAYLSAKIDELIGVTTAIAAGDLSQNVPVERDDAIGKLALAFNTMTESLGGMAAAAEAIASGDLTVEVKPQSPKDVLGNAFSGMIRNLSNLIAQTRVVADSIAGASGEVMTGNDDLAQRTEEQAASLEETASSMEEMTATVKQNAENARSANLLAVQARDCAEKGGQVVGSAVATMADISTASKRIADIISVIDEIAFQTNLLALNAAVEAARVGEQGRGFAVVAAEVRNLAGRSATAAKEIKALVQDSVQKVQEGSGLVNQSGKQLEEIVSSVKKVADLIADITGAAQEQASGIEQVNKAITLMDQITQQNAALVEEASAASQGMNRQAADLQQVVGQFRLQQSFLDASLAKVQSAPNPSARPAARPGQSRPKPTTFTPNRFATTKPDDFEEF